MAVTVRGLTEGFCVFLLYMPLNDIRSTHTEILASSKTYRHMYRLLWPCRGDIVPKWSWLQLRSPEAYFIAETIFY